MTADVVGRARTFKLRHQLSVQRVNTTSWLMHVSWFAVGLDKTPCILDAWLLTDPPVT